jgi:hypothetical protein
MENELIPIHELIKKGKLNDKGELVLMEAPGEGKRIFITAAGLVGVQECDATKDDKN